MSAMPIPGLIPIYEDYARCVHCGFCLSACPTYRLWNLEYAQETTTPFPQRWGLLRKGCAVFRREDGYPVNQLSDGGSGPCLNFLVPCLPGPPCVTW